MVALTLTITFALAACHAPPPVARRPWPGIDATLAQLARRARRVHGFSAQCAVTVTPPDHDPLSFDGALAAREPGMLRLQGWKFNQKVVDFTANARGMWLWTRGQDSHKSGGEARGAAQALGWPLPRGAQRRGADGRVRCGGLPWLGPLMTPLDPSAAVVMENDPAAGRLTVRWPLVALGRDRRDQADHAPPPAQSKAGGWSLVGVIDRPTRTLRSLRVLDPRQRVLQRIDLSDYRMIDTVPWPSRITARGKVTLDLRLSDIELNPDLPAAAFTPPKRARRLGR